MNWLQSLHKKKSEKEEIPESMHSAPDLGKEIASSQGRILVFLANGADLTETMADDQEICRGFIGAQPAYLSLKPAAVNCFVHPDADFLGFFAEKREKEGWLCRTKSGQWLPLGAVADQEKTLIEEGEDAGSLFDKEAEVIYLKAQWKGRGSQQRVNCGWPMFRNQLMAHAFGGYKDHTYCNTPAALENGIKNGFQYFETDFSYTYDERLVVCHGWTESACSHTGFRYSPSYQKMRYRRIMHMRVFGDRIMDVGEFYERISALPYVYELDFHDVRGETARKIVRSLLEDFQYDTTVLDRLLIQVYSQQMFLDIDSVYHFRQYQYLVGKNMDHLDDIITFCLDHGICALAVRANLAKPCYVNKIRNAGLYCLCYTVSKDAAYAKKLLDSGVNTVCTDWITPAVLRETENDFGHYPFYVYYYSSSSEAKEQYSALISERKIEGKLEKFSSGKLEFQDQSIWENDGKRALVPNAFAVPGKKFAGWNLRLTVDGKQLWYCEDHCYHSGSDLKGEKQLEKVLFRDQEILPVWTFKKGQKLVMTAVWKTIEV